LRLYKSLALDERAFLSSDNQDETVSHPDCRAAVPEVRSIYQWLTMRMDAHVFLCMLAFYIEHHMRVALAPLLFADHEPNNRERSLIV